jgi:hypothetical protein
MQNDLKCALSWVAFILERCPFKNREALAAQFTNARLEEFCSCGCNSFALVLADPEHVPPIASRGRYGPVYQADFRDLNATDELRWLEIQLFADEAGHLKRVDVQYVGNGIPIPEHMMLEDAPFRIDESDTLIN